MKQIKVDCCGNCPFLECYRFIGYCTYLENNGMEIENKDVIHPDCKLEDMVEQ